MDVCRPYILGGWALQRYPGSGSGDAAGGLPRIGVDTAPQKKYNITQKSSQRRREGNARNRAGRGKGDLT